jgi:hypothetical protein
MALKHFVFVQQFVILILSSVTMGAEPSWTPDPALVERLSLKRPDVNYDEAKVPKFDLPDPLQSADAPIKTSQQWIAHREALLKQFRTHMFGRSPGKPQTLKFDVLEQNTEALDGAATLRRIAVRSGVADRTHQFTLVIVVPNHVTGKVPLFLLINNRPLEKLDVATKTDFWPVKEMIERGYGIAAFATQELAPDDAEHFREGVIRLFEGDATTRAPDAGKAISAWAWGATRAMDYFETDPRVDAKKIALVGHSRGGKTSLWAGAQDERFAMVVSNASGCGGASIARRRYGETLKIINNRFPYWFCDNFTKFNDHEDQLPFDQHQLLGLIAPRPLYIASGSEDLWGDPRGEFLALVHASPVYALWGNRTISADELPAVEAPLFAGAIGFHIHKGPHALGLYDWQRFADFADIQWQRSK